MPVRFLTNYRPRRSPRRRLRVPVIVCLENGEQIATTHTVDFSMGGAKIKIDESVELPEQFRITLSDRGDVQRLCRLVWRTANEVGVRFVQQKSEQPSPAAPAKA